MKIPFWQTKTFWGALSTATLGILSLYDVGGKIVQTATYVMGFLTVVFARDAIESGNADVRKVLDAKGETLPPQGDE
ncbi:MAG: hypothetical protein HC933_16075 [Pleurocapsa sp. SU_196_0]|nr:hypothetical protein [Pleurocapsa sp. SU_196_0]